MQDNNPLQAIKSNAMRPRNVIEVKIKSSYADANGLFLADWLLTSHPEALQEAQEVFGISPADWASDRDIQSLPINQAAKKLLGMTKR